jgi:hypothetical protein
MGETTMAHTIFRDTGRRVEVRGQDEGTSNGVNRRSEFILAMSIFVTMSVIGTAFGLWMVGAYNAKPASAPPTVEGEAPVPQVPPVDAARPDPVAPADRAVDKR